MKIQYLLLFLILISCEQKKITSTEGVKTYVIESYNSSNQDSLSYELWYETAFLLPESDIPGVPKLDSVLYNLRTHTQVFRDSIIQTIKEGKFSPELSKNDSLKTLINNIVDNKDFDLYCRSFLNYYPLSLILAEEFDFCPAYYHVVWALWLKDKTMNRQIEKTNLTKCDNMRFDHLEINERELALYCLIMSYKKGNIENSKLLACYFREGEYFPKDIATANKLDSIYRNKPIIEMK